MRLAYPPVTVALLILVAPLPVGGQTFTALVNPIEGPDEYGVRVEVTDMLIDSLLRTGAFDVVDARIAGQGGGDFDLSTILVRRRQSVEIRDGEYGTRIGVSVHITATAGAEYTFLTVSGEDASSVVRPAGIGRPVQAVPGGSRAQRQSGSRAQARSQQTYQDRLDAAFRRTVQSILANLASRLVTYFEIMGDRATVSTGGGTVEGSVVAIMDPTNAVIDRGSSDGLLPGEVLEVRRGEVFTNETGEIIFSSSETIGEAQVGEVQNAGAVVTAVAPLEFEEGDAVVRRSPAPSADEYLETGNALLEASFHEEASRELLNARNSGAHPSDVLLLLTVARLKTGEHDSAYESLADLLDGGEIIELAVRHGHAFGQCLGTLVLSSETISYSSPQENDPDHRFDVPLTGIVESDLRFDQLLRIRAPSAEHVQKNRGESKNWVFTFDLYGENTEFARIVERYVAERRGPTAE